jgi:hypothetical protein
MVKQILASATYGSSMIGIAALLWIRKSNRFASITPVLLAELDNQLSIYEKPVNLKELNKLERACLSAAANVSFGQTLGPGFAFASRNFCAVATLHQEFGTFPPFILIIIKIASMALTTPSGSLAHHWSDSPLPLGSKSLVFWIRAIFASEFASAIAANTNIGDPSNAALRLIKKSLFADYVSRQRSNSTKAYYSNSFALTASFRNLSFAFASDARALNNLSDFRTGAFDGRSTSKLFEIRAIDSTYRNCPLCRTGNDSACHYAYICNVPRISSLRSGTTLTLLNDAHALASSYATSRNLNLEEVLRREGCLSTVINW